MDAPWRKSTESDGEAAQAHGVDEVLLHGRARAVRNVDDAEIVSRQGLRSSMPLYHLGVKLDGVLVSPPAFTILAGRFDWARDTVAVPASESTTIAAREPLRNRRRFMDDARGSCSG